MTSFRCFSPSQLLTFYELLRLYHCPGICRGYDLCIPAEPPGLDLRLPRLPRGKPFFDLRIRNLQFELPVRNVDKDFVAVMHDRDRAAFGRLWGNVPNARALAAAREPAVGDQGNGLAEPHAGDGGGRREHFAHARSALRPLIADHDHVAGLDLSG